jgi:hypothetical protein
MLLNIMEQPYLRSEVTQLERNSPSFKTPEDSLQSSEEPVTNLRLNYMTPVHILIS